jgi:predicted ATPase
LSSEVLQQIVAKTDGVPLFVEELTKSVVETLREQVTGDGGQEHGKIEAAQQGVPVPALGVPATLQDALMARLDRLGTAKEVAQQGAVVGRELTYELLRAVSPLTEAALQKALTKLVEAELLYRRGRPPQATYLFKHALVQETAYQSLLKSKRQQYHHQIAQVFEARFSETIETQPELVAHHYTEAGLGAQAIPYWERAGQRASQRSAHVEAIRHLTKGLELLKTLPDTPERVREELTLQMALSVPLMVTKGYAAPEVEQAFTRARELYRQVGETPQLFSMLLGLSSFYMVRAEMKTARELAEQCLRLAQSMQSSLCLIWAYNQLGQILSFLGEIALAQDHMIQGIARYDPQKHSPLVSGTTQDPGVSCLCFASRILWLLGYPEQALERIQEALTLAQELSHPFSLVFAFRFAAALHQYRRERPAAQEWAERTIALATEQGFPFWSALGTILRGWALTEQGQIEEGVVQIRQGLTAYRATGSEYAQSSYLALLAEAYKKAGQIEEGLSTVSEALMLVNRTGERYYEAELYRLKGELSLQSRQVMTSQDKSEFTNPQPSIFNPQAEAEAEACFLRAIEIARTQQARSWEVRASTSLARLWQQQGKQHEAHTMLGEVYGWFTEGFDTKDLQEAKVLLEELT